MYAIGFGVLFDTFVNPEHAGGHQDVALFVNDGTKSLDQLNDEPKVGCMAPGIRYHEGNAAFSASLNMSRAKIQYKDNYVAILVDATNTGDWVHCYGGHVNLPDSWVDNARIGITASTGGLADNHDVIAIKVYEYVTCGSCCWRGGECGPFHTGKLTGVLLPYFMDITLVTWATWRSQRATRR